MKKIILLYLALLFIVITANSQDTLYMYHSGMVVMKRALTEIDSITFSASEMSDVVTDIDGNVYNTIEIGSQTWFATNLHTSHYNDGTPINFVADNTEWQNLESGAYTWYNNDSASYEIPFGKLYNWHAVNTGKLCPSGWHVAREDEWLALGNYLEGSSVAGGKLKTTGTVEEGNGLWYSPNTGATNSTGFNGLPDGRRYSNGSFELMGLKGAWWSSIDTPGYAFFWSLEYNSERLNGQSQSMNEGLSVRCIKD